MLIKTNPHSYCRETERKSQGVSGDVSASGVLFGEYNPKPSFVRTAKSAGCSALYGSACPFGSDWSFSGGRSCGRCPGSDSSLTTLYTSQTNKANSLTLITIKNQDTGQVYSFNPYDRTQYLFDRSARAFSSAVDAFDLQVVFLTLTLGADVEVAQRELNRFLSWLRMRFKRLGLPFFYLWVVEVQLKRYLRSGVKARHWHLAIAVPDGCLPDVEFLRDSFPHYKLLRDGSVVGNREIHDVWGRGQVFCATARAGTSVGGYLSKYLRKGLSESFDLGGEYSNLRRFGSSRFGSFRYPQWAKDGLAAVRVEGVVPVDDLFLRLEGNRLNGYVLAGGGSRANKQRCPGASVYERVLSLRSPWRIVDNFSCRFCGESDVSGGVVNEVCSAFR